MDFSFDPCFGETISSELEEIDKRKKYIYIPKVEEFQVSYRITQKSAKIEITTITKEKCYKRNFYVITFVDSNTFGKRMVNTKGHLLN